MRNPKLNTVILRGMADSINRIDPENLNEESIVALREVESAIEDLKSAIIGLRIIEEWEQQERDREAAGVF